MNKEVTAMFSEEINVILARKEPIIGDKKIMFSFNGDFMSISEDEICGYKNIKLFTTDELIKNSLATPAFVQIQITNRCNMRCEHCYVSPDKSTLSEMNNRQIMGLLDRLQRKGVLIIQWVGGEVFVKKGFVNLIRYANRLGFEQSILSNGIFFGKTKNIKLVEEIWKYCYGIQISVNSYGDKYNLFTGGKKFWNSLVSGIKLLSKTKPIDAKLYTATIARKENLKQLENIVIKFGDYVDFFRVGKEIPMGRSSISQEDSIEALKLSWPIINNLRKKYGVMITHPFDKYDFDQNEILPSVFKTDSGARIFMYISVTGDCYPFPLLLKFPEYNGGNIFKKSILEIWKSEAFSMYRNVTRSDTGCGNCNKVCQLQSRYHFIYNGKVHLYEKPFPHHGCPIGQRFNN
ncbi:MAG: radical SAM protein [Xanthomonadaceae bacterium]|nr:radical SAM protein [Rhodospirillaceae bacterium]NIA18097.1 radical SAM protein [Xanthomonadaceae bacterium]